MAAWTGEYFHRQKKLRPFHTYIEDKKDRKPITDEDEARMKADHEQLMREMVGKNG